MCDCGHVQRQRLIVKGYKGLHVNKENRRHLRDWLTKVYPDGPFVTYDYDKMVTEIEHACLSSSDVPSLPTINVDTSDQQTPLDAVLEDLDALVDNLKKSKKGDHVETTSGTTS